MNDIAYVNCYEAEQYKASAYDYRTFPGAEYINDDRKRHEIK